MNIGANVLFLLRRGPSTTRRWPVVRRCSRDFLLRVRLFSELLVPEAVCGFSRFEFNVSPVGDNRGNFRTKKGSLGAISLGFFFRKFTRKNIRSSRYLTDLTYIIKINSRNVCTRKHPIDCTKSDIIIFYRYVC